MTESYTIQLCDCERIILQEIEDKRIYRNSISLTYAFALRADENIDWTKINQAILKRWSMAGLKYIKERAWKIFEGKVIPGVEG